MTQDPDPMPWGAQDRYQAHFIVRTDDGKHNLAARTVLQTSGRFAEKKVAGVGWSGTGGLASRLNADQDLNDMIARQPVRDAEICVESVDSTVRIRGKWSNHLEFGITKELFEIYDRIAGHIRQL